MKKSAEIGKVIDAYVNLLENDLYFEKSKVQKMITDAKNIKTSYSKLEITEDVNHIYEALCIKGNKIIEDIKQNKQDKKGNLSKAKMYIRYLKAADGDFKGESTPRIQSYFRYFMGSAVLFLALSPQYFGFILPALMFVPIFLGVRGIKNRSYHGWILSLSIIPLALMTSVIWIRFGFGLFGNVESYAAALAQSNNISGTAAILLTVVPPLLGVVLFTTMVMTIYNAYKSKDYYI